MAKVAAHESVFRSTTKLTNKLIRRLLLCGVAAGPLYIIVGLIEILTRESFDPKRHPLSLMSNGPLGWIHISLLIISGLLVIASAFGMRRVLHPGRGATWGPLLVGLYGVGLICAGCFVADPSLGFPPGTPEGMPEVVTLHGNLHFITGAVGFFGLIVACFVFASRFISISQRGWAAYSILTGVLFSAAFYGIATSNGEVWINLAFTAAVVIGWGWVTVISTKLFIEMNKN